MKIPLARPDITELEKKAVLGVLDTPNLSLGPKLPEFEGRLAEYVGVKYAVAVNSDTSALHLIIKALGIGEGDEVITTPFSFTASANCLLFERAKPIFVDIDERTLNIDPARVKETVLLTASASHVRVPIEVIRSAKACQSVIGNTDLPYHVAGKQSARRVYRRRRQS